MDHLEEQPPFALPDQQNSPQHYFLESPVPVGASASVSPSPRDVAKLHHSMNLPVGKQSKTSDFSQSSTPPGLIESAMTDCSSAVCDSDVIEQNTDTPYLDASSTFLFSSLPTIPSINGGSSSLYPSSHQIPTEFRNEGQKGSHVSSGASVGFSQLLRAAGGDPVHLNQSNMPSLTENEELVESSLEPGALISSPDNFAASTTHSLQSRQWQPDHRFFNRQPVQPSASTGLREPLLAGENGFPNSRRDAAIERARTHVISILEDDRSFEVSTKVAGTCTVEGVMNVVANPELLTLWCDPIQSLIVTSSSDSAHDSIGSEQGREYEGEWIEATTSALKSPGSNVERLHRAGQAVMELLGIAAYGKVTMFVERRRGQVGLTVGPFTGGLNTSHTISIREESGNVVIVSRVHLHHQPEETTFATMFGCGGFNSCLSTCLLPSVQAYMEQVSTSIAKLRLLVENEDFVRGLEGAKSN